MTRRGGVLLDLFIIMALIAGGLWAWMSWKRGTLSFSVPRVAGLPVPIPSVAAPVPAAEADLDVSDRSAWIQSRVREVLAKHGVKDKHVVKAYNAERREAGIQWLEDTLEVRRPFGFNERGFLAALAPDLAERRLVVMDDRREGARWTLAVGDRRRVYQRVIFEAVR